MALHEASQAGRLSARIVCVVGSREEAPVVERARAAGLRVEIIDPKSMDADEYAAALLRVLRAADAAAIALAGYLRRLPSPVVEAYRHRGRGR